MIMDNISHTEENYLKAIYKISENSAAKASTNAIAADMSTSAASVTDMIKRLNEKGLVIYESRRGVSEDGQESRARKEFSGEEKEVALTTPAS